MNTISAESRRIDFLTLIAVVLLGLVLLTLKAGVGNYAFDDAYIIEHSVDGILAGHESRFIGSTPWDGVTSPVYVGSVALLAMVAPIGFSHWVVSSLSTLLLASGWLLLCHRHSLGRGLSLVVVLVGLLPGVTSYHLANGLETGMAMAALTWTLIALDHERPPRWGYALAGLLCFIRPELAALSVLFGLCILVRRPACWRQGTLIAAVFFAVSALALLIVSGAIIPNTLSAKAYFFAEGCQPPSFKSSLVLSAIWAFIGGLGLFAAGFVLALGSKHRMVLLAFVALFLLAYFHRLPGALFHNHARYLYLLLPIALTGWVTCLGHANRTIRLSSTLLGAAAAVSVMLSLPTSLRLYTDETRAISADNAEMARWVARHVPNNAVVLVHDAGRVSMLGEQPLMDLVGLKSPFSANLHRQTTFAQCRRVPETVSDIARYAGATYIVTISDWDEIFGLTDSLRLTGWSVERADKVRGDTLYKVYKIADDAKNPG